MARQSLWNSSMYMEFRSKERKNKAQTLAVQALRVAPDLPEAHMALGEWFRMTERNYDAALKEFEIATGHRVDAASVQRPPLTHHLPPPSRPAAERSNR